MANQATLSGISARHRHDEAVTATSEVREAGSLSSDARRLLVLVPDLDIDEANLAQQVWSLAEPRGLPIVYLSITAEPDRESLVRRRLATLAAITRTDALRVNTHCQLANDWMQAVQDLWRPGDLIVVPSQEASPLSRVIFSALPMPIGVLPGVKVGAKPGRRWLRLAFWPMALLAIGGFFLVQVLIQQSAQGLAQSFLLCLSALAEVGLLVFLNNLLS